MDQGYIALVFLQQTANCSIGEFSRERVIGDLIDFRPFHHTAVQTFDKVSDPVSCLAALFRVLPVPKLDFAWHRILLVLDTLLPVFQYARFVEAISDTPRSHVTKLFKERIPSAEST